jgi:nucleotide-binding universal stress UspA family protein
VTTLDRILLATDLSPASDPAWHEAHRLGQLCAAEIVVVHVVPPSYFVPPGLCAPSMAQDLVDAAYRAAQDGVEQMLAGMAGSPVKVRTRIETGVPASRVLEIVREEAADLLVVGTHGRSGLGRVVLGSVADRVLRQAACPVVTVRSDLRRDHRHPTRRICYATDFSETARAAWPWVLRLARPAAAEVDLVHVALGPLPDRHLAAEVIGEMARFFDEQARAEAERFLQNTELPRARVHVRIGHGVEADQIVHWARAREADLIIMGTHGWSGVVRWMLGSVAQRVIQTAPCPVLTVGPTGGRPEDRHGS